MKTIFNENEKSICEMIMEMPPRSSKLDQSRRTECYVNSVMGYKIKEGRMRTEEKRKENIYRSYSAMAVRCLYGS
jgi:hypothetical protein